MILAQSVAGTDSKAMPGLVQEHGNSLEISGVYMNLTFALSWGAGLGEMFCH